MMTAVVLGGLLAPLYQHVSRLLFSNLTTNYWYNFYQPLLPTYQILAASTSHFQHLRCTTLLLSVLKNFKLLAVVYLEQISLNTHLKVHSAQSTCNCGCNVDACQSRRGNWEGAEGRTLGEWLHFTSTANFGSWDQAKKGKKAKEGEEQMRGPMGTQDMI